MAYHYTDVAYARLYKTMRFLLHFTAAVQFSYAIYYDYNYVKFPESGKIIQHPFGGKFKYLTFLDAIIQASYYIISLVNDILGTNEIAPKRLPAIRKFKDLLMSILAFPIALNVAISFWTLYAIDRELVFPKVLDAVFPSWLNHVLHTNIAIFIVLELVTSYREYPSRAKGLTYLSIFLIGYLIWIHIVKYYSGVWVYPVLEVLHLLQRVVFFISVLVFTFCIYLLGEFMNNNIWAKQLHIVMRKSI